MMRTHDISAIHTPGIDPVEYPGMTIFPWDERMEREKKTLQYLRYNPAYS
jgi:hypothetical protein